MMNEPIELLLRILCDVLPARADAAYLFAETEPNQESVFAAGRRPQAGQIPIPEPSMPHGIRLRWPLKTGFRLATMGARTPTVACRPPGP